MVGVGTHNITDIGHNPIGILVGIVSINIAAQDGWVGEPVALGKQRFSSSETAINSDTRSQQKGLGAVGGGGGVVDTLCHPHLTVAGGCQGSLQIIEGILPGLSVVQAISVLVHEEYAV